MPLEIEQRGKKSYWVVGFDPEDVPGGAYGSYETRAEAEEDKRGHEIGEESDDAKLLATATELLKACELMRDRITDYANANDVCWKDWEHAYRVDDAIEKATNNLG